MGKNIRKKYYYKPSKTTKFFYNTKLGRFSLKMFFNRPVVNLTKTFMNTYLSVPLKNKTIRTNHMDLSLYEKHHFKSYNDFFTRKYKHINFDKNENHFISPCESKLLVVKLNKDTVFEIKGSKYSAKEVIKNDIIDDFDNGYALIFRLDVTDYHRYIYIDDGYRTPYRYIKGKMHTVQPIVYDKVKVFHQNTREWTLLLTKNFGEIIQCEVGAMYISRIVNHFETEFKRGDEKGYFEFGGSTIIVFVKKDVITIDEDIMKNSMDGIETVVKLGEKIGIKKTSEN